MSETNCLEFERRLNEVLDARENPRDDHTIVGHAMECFQCDRYLATQVHILEAVNTAGLAKCEKPIAANRESDHQSRRAWFIGAALSICVVIGFSLPRHAEKSDADQPTMLAKVTPAENAAVELMVESPAEVDESSTTMMVAMDGAVESWNQFLASSTENAEWLEPVATPIRPLADSMTSTFNVLRKTMPGVRRMQDQPRSEGLDSAQRLLSQISLA